MNNNVNCSLASYDAIKKALISATITSNALEELKKHFEADIASKRLQKCIGSIADLLMILERRDIISEYDINSLHIVAKYCMNDAIIGYLNNYVPPFDSHSTPCKNEYRELRIAQRLRDSLNLHNQVNSIESISAFGAPVQQPPTTMPVCAFSTDKKSAVYKKLSKELGSFWRRFGRELDVTEGDMDNIELQFPRDLPSRVYKLMEIFEEDESHDPKRRFLIICRALDKCQRKDLRRKIEEIMSY